MQRELALQKELDWRGFGTKWKKKVLSQEIWVASRSCKGQGICFPLEQPKGMQYDWHDFSSSLRNIMVLSETSDIQKYETINLCCFNH